MLGEFDVCLLCDRLQCTDWDDFAGVNWHNSCAASVRIEQFEMGTRLRDFDKPCCLGLFNHLSGG